MQCRYVGRHRVDEGIGLRVDARFRRHLGVAQPVLAEGHGQRIDHLAHRYVGVFNVCS